MLLKTIGNGGNGQFWSTAGISFDSSGNAWIVDQGR